MAEEEEVPPHQPEHVTRIAVRPPPFDEHSVTRWFVILESQFSLANITVSSTKFTHVLSHLPMQVINKLSDTVISCNNYATLKDGLIQLYARSIPELFDSLIVKNNLCCTKPTLYLQELRQLGERLNVDDEIIKCKFLKSLPDNIRASLIAYDTSSLDEMARTADTILAYNTNNNPVHNINPNDNFSSIYNVNQRLNKYDATNFDFSQTSGPVDHGYRSSRSSNSYRQNQAPNYSRNPNYSTPNFSDISIPVGVRSFHENQRPQVCRFHLYYGKRAKSCKPWCILSSPHLNIQPNSRPSSRSSSPQPNYNSHSGN